MHSFVDINILFLIISVQYYYCVYEAFLKCSVVYFGRNSNRTIQNDYDEQPKEKIPKTMGRPKHITDEPNEKIREEDRESIE